MPVTPVLRVEQLGDAVVADRDVGRNRRAWPRGPSGCRRCESRRRRAVFASTSAMDTVLIRASGGASAHSRRPNSSMRAIGPCTSMNTAPESLPTNPASPSSLAIRWTNGRKPTPCTTPVDGEPLPDVVGSQHQCVGHVGRQRGADIEVLGGTTLSPLRLVPHSAHVAITPFCCHGFPDETHRRRVRHARSGFD